MIRVTVELISAVDRSRDKVLGVMEIVNDGTSEDERYGNYRTNILRAPDFERITRSGRVERHGRLHMTIWYLVAKALKSMGYPE